MQSSGCNLFGRLPGEHGTLSTMPGRNHGQPYHVGRPSSMGIRHRNNTRQRVTTRTTPTRPRFADMPTRSDRTPRTRPAHVPTSTRGSVPPSQPRPHNSTFHGQHGHNVRHGHNGSTSGHVHVQPTAAPDTNTTRTRHEGLPNTYTAKT